MGRFRIGRFAAAASLLASPAFAHTLPDGHHGFAHGAAHMFGGADHLAIAALVGWWVSASPAGRGSAVLAAYGAALLGAGFLGVALPGAAIDGLLLALILAAGAMIFLGGRGWSARLAACLAVAMAAVQGFAHVADISGIGGDIAANAAFVSGLAVTTVLVAAAFAGAFALVRRFRPRHPSCA